MNQRVAEKVRQAFFSSIGRAVVYQAKQLIELRNTHGPFGISGLRLGFLGNEVTQDSGTTEDFQLSDSELKQRLAADVAGGQTQP